MATDSAARGQALLAEGRPAEAREALQDARDHAVASGAGPVTLADIDRLLGSALRESGDLEGSAQALRSAVGLTEDLGDVDGGDLVLAIALRSLAVTEHARGRNHDASTARARALRVVGELLISRPEDAVDVLDAVAADLAGAAASPEVTEGADPAAWLAGRAADLPMPVSLRAWLRLLHRTTDDATRGAAWSALTTLLDRALAAPDVKALLDPLGPAADGTGAPGPADAEPLLVTAAVAAEVAFALDRGRDHAASADLHHVAFVLRTVALGPDHPATVASRVEVAELSRVLDRVEESEHHFREALASHARGGTLDDLAGAHVLNNLADLLISAGRPEEARPLVTRALSQREALAGADSELAWRSRLTLATCDLESGDARAAVDAAEAATARPEYARDGSWHLILALGRLATGSAREAEPILSALVDATDPREVERSTTVPVYLRMVAALVACLADRGATGEASGVAARVLDTVRGALPDMVSSSAESGITRLAAGLARVQSVWIRALLESPERDPSWVADAFELVQLTKGLRTRYLRWRQPGVGNVDHYDPPGSDHRAPQVRAEVARLEDRLVRGALAAEDATAFARSPEASALRARVRRLERLLAAGIAPWETIMELGPALGKSFVPEGAAVLEIVVVPGAAWSPTAPAGPDRYAAFVVRHGDPRPELLDLGLRLDVDVAVEEFREAVISGRGAPPGADPPWRRRARSLGRRVLGPAWPHVHDPAHLIVCPDGALAAVPTEILETPAGDLLTDVVRVSYLPRAADLASRAMLFRTEGPPVVLAGPDHDLSKAATAARSGQVVAAAWARGAVPGGARFVDLPQARAEGEAVAALLGVAPLTGVWALATELLGMSEPEIVHIAGHGFALPAAAVEDDAVLLGTPLGNAVDRRMVLDDPLQRSGLALAGANAVLDGMPVPPEVGDGIVHASQIQQLDLQRTDLVVLSACRTGLGDLALGDGAHGLRRAFLAAGCRSVVSTLWDVPEDGSRRLVEHFYTLLLQGRPRHEALAEARAVVRADHPDSPVHWAGYVLDGEWGPLHRSVGANVRVAVVNAREWGLNDGDPEALDRLADMVRTGSPAYPSDGPLPPATVLRRVLDQDEVPSAVRVEATETLADLASRLGDLGTAVALSEELAADPAVAPSRAAGIRYSIGVLHHRDGRPDLAAQMYDRALDMECTPELRARLRVNRGVARIATDRTHEALADFTAVIEDAGAPIDQQYMALLNRADATAASDVTASLADLDAALALGVADEAERRHVEAFRAQVLATAGDGPG